MQTVDFTKFNLKPGDRVLDLGCGEGRHTIGAYITEDVFAVGVDLSLNDVSTARERAADFVDPAHPHKRMLLACANGLHLPFADATFDKVICSEVLEHIPDYRGVLKEIQRVLKPGGDFAASVPRRWPERICWWLSSEYHEVEGGHIRIFDSAELRDDIEREGFLCTGRHWAHALHVPYWWLKCLFWDQRDDHPLIVLYHRFLVWDMLDRPLFTRTLEWLANPLLGKSVVMYFRKGAAR